MKINKKIVLIISAAILVAMFAALFFVYKIFTDTLRKNISDSEMQLAQHTISEIDLLLFNRQKDIESLASGIFLREYLSGRQDELKPIEEKHSDVIFNIGAWDALEILDGNGKEVSLVGIGEEYSDVGVVAEKSAAFQRALAGEIYVSDLIIPEGEGKPVMIFASPIRDIHTISKPIIGVLVGYFNWDIVRDLLDEVKTNFVHLYTNEGVLIAINKREHQEAGSFEQNLFEDFSYREDVKNAAIGKSFSEVVPSLHGDYLSLTTFVTERGYLGYGGHGWILSLDVPVQTVFAPAVITVRSLLLLLLVVFIFTELLILLLVDRAILRPIKSLTEATKDIAFVNLGTKIKIDAKDEIGELATSFNLMKEKLNDAYHGLEEKVRIRTKELAQKNEKLSEAQVAMANLLEDITLEKNKSQAEKIKTQAMLENIGDGVIATDENENVILINKAARRMLKWSGSVARSKNLNDLLPVEDGKGRWLLKEERPATIAIVKRKTITSSFLNPYYYRRKDNTTFPAAITATPVIIERRVVGAIVVFRDITKERDIDQAKSEFVSVASHQLRTPLTGIKWFVELLAKLKISAAAKDYVRQIAISNERMVRLVDDLLNVSRIETGRKFDILTKKTDILPIIRQAIAAQQILSRYKKININCLHQGDKKIELPIDEEKIRQALQNLINNAIKYSPQGGVVEVGCINDNRKTITFYVKDNGIGIPKKQQHRIFEKFFRAENALTTHTDGTGLGLYIVKAIVEGHGGKVWFKSREGEDTTFFFSLPKNNV